MQALLLVGWVTLAAAALPDKATLKSVFVDGSGTKAPGLLTQAQIDTIDRELTIYYDLPAFKMGSGMPAPFFNDTCGMPTISCPAQKFTVTPGMEVSTISVRGTAMTSASDYMNAVGPTITFTMNAGKKYTFLMADGLSGDTYWASGMVASVKQVRHYAVLNMDQSSGLSTDLKTMYYRPGNIVASTPNIYAFMVWEHTTNATMPEDIGYANMGFTTQAWIQAAGIANASLVAMNYFKGYGNVFSRALMKSNANALVAASAPTCTAGAFSSSDKMCMGAMAATTTTTMAAMGATTTTTMAAMVATTTTTMAAMAATTTTTMAAMDAATTTTMAAVAATTTTTTTMAAMAAITTTTMASTGTSWSSSLALTVSDPDVFVADQVKAKNIMATSISASSTNGEITKAMVTVDSVTKARRLREIGRRLAGSVTCAFTVKYQASHANPVLTKASLNSTMLQTTITQQAAAQGVNVIVTGLEMETPTLNPPTMTTDAPLAAGGATSMGASLLALGSALVIATLGA